MTPPPSPGKRRVALVQLIPNMLTIAAICAGLTAIRLATQGAYPQAVQLILVACVLDGIDGRIARLLRSASRLGAELDSLADFLNFGVATPLVLFSWALGDLRGLGWAAVLIFSICCVMRLARFNIGEKSGDADTPEPPKPHFQGIPSPLGAILALFPMFLAFATEGAVILPDLVIAGLMMGVALAMISTVPTYSFKNARVFRENVKFYLVGFAVLVSVAITFFWTVMALFCVAYLVVVIAGLFDRTLRNGGEGQP